MLKIKEHHIAGYKRVIEGINPEAGLHCFISVHDTTLGPSLGGLRIFPYASPEDALQDVLKLSKAMTLKSAVAEDGMGGGKSVIIANPCQDKTEKLLFAFAEVINHLEGDYIAAEDVGSNTQDMITLSKKTPYVCALPIEKSSGDPSRFTAWGVFRGMQAVARKLWGTSSLRNKTIFVQGLGSVGSKLADTLFWEGANLLLCDVNPQKIHDLMLLYGAAAVKANHAEIIECDIYAPCALGGALDEHFFESVNCRAVAGAANNQLKTPQIGQLLHDHGILYAPDYIINAGGIINAAMEFDLGGYDPKISRDKVNHIYDILLALFEKAEKENKPTHEIADAIAEYNLLHGVGKRIEPVKFKF